MYIMIHVLQEVKRKKKHRVFMLFICFYIFHIRDKEINIEIITYIYHI